MRYQSRPRPLYQVQPRSMRRWVCYKDPTSVLCWSLAFFIILAYIAFNVPEDSALDIMRYVKRQADIGPHLQQRLRKLTHEFTLDPNDTDIDGYEGTDEKGVKLMLDLPDLRFPECMDRNYDGNYVQRVSIVITFHDQPWYLLVWTVNSVLFKTPYHLLKEIILADHCSTNMEMKTALEKYVYELPKTRLIRVKTCQGYPSGAHMLGAKAARGDVLVFLDSHVDVGEGWLEPLLAALQESPRALIIPNVVVMYPGFQKQMVNPVEPWTGSFTWDLRFVPRPRDYNARRLSTPTEPFYTPTQQGSMFAVDRQFFLRIGGFDDGMDTLVSENLELSFRAWLCADGIQVVPCSFITHLFTQYFKHNHRYSGGIKESQRTADIWLDKYRHYYYAAVPQIHPYSMEDSHSIQERREVYRRMRCRSFDWFLEKLVPEMLIPWPHVAYQGHMRNLGSNMCVMLDKSTGNLLMEHCMDSQSQYLYLSNDDRIFVNQTHCVSFQRFQAFVVSCDKEPDKAVQWDPSTEVPEIVKSRARNLENVLHFRSRRSPEHPQCFTHIQENGVDVAAAWPCSEQVEHAYWEFDYKMDFTGNPPELNFGAPIDNGSSIKYLRVHLYLFLILTSVIYFFS